jgi:nitroreductase
MRRLASFLLLAATSFPLSARAAAPLPVVTASAPVRIWVDQIGYRVQGAKMAVVAADAPIPDRLQIELRDEKTNHAVWKLADNPAALRKFNGGNKDGESGDYISYLDFSDFRTPGRYYFAMTAPNKLRSYHFNIAENPYHAAGLAAWKAYYYNRADGEKLAKYAGLWTHGKAFLGPGQATEAKVYQWKVGNRWPDQVGTQVIDPKSYDVHGGWWDAGDMNKYTSNTSSVQNMLLMAYEMSQGRPKDKELNIPESGNGIPDVLDEIRCGTEFLLRDSDGTGAAFGRVHMEPGSPPDSITKPVQLTMPNSEVTMGRACALAYAAVVWRESKLDDAFAQKCQTESLKSWRLLQKKPHPWPKNPQNPNRPLDQGEMRNDQDQDYPIWRATAAACYFRLGGNKEYDEIVHEAYAKRDQVKLDVIEPYLWVYMKSKGADPAMVASIRKAILAKADSFLGQMASRGYRVFMEGYWWGSNQLVGHNGAVLVLASQLTDDPAKKKAYLDGAEQYVHYLFGRNPLGMCFLSNMKMYGAERSAMIMFHTWVGNENSKYGARYVGEGEGKIGPFPGIVIGGPNGSMKRMVEDLDWRKNPWEYTEPDIMYQSQCLRMLDAFTWPQKAARSEEPPAEE